MPSRGELRFLGKGFIYGTGQDRSTSSDGAFFWGDRPSGMEQPQSRETQKCENGILVQADKTAIPGEFSLGQ
jgi:hypothetical protein